MSKGRDRPRREPKRKKQPKVHGAGPTGTATPTYQPPMRPVEVIKPKRKEREPEPEEPNSQDEG